MTQPGCNLSKPDASVACKSVSINTAKLGSGTLTFTATTALGDTKTTEAIKYTVVTRTTPLVIKDVDAAATGLVWIILIVIFCLCGGCCLIIWICMPSSNNDGIMIDEEVEVIVVDEEVVLDDGEVVVVEEEVVGI